MTELLERTEGHLAETDPADAVKVARMGARAGGTPVGFAATPAERRNIVVPSRQAVVIVERNLLFRAGLLHVLGKKQFRVVAECSTIPEMPRDGLDAGGPILLLIGLEGEPVGSLRAALAELRQRHDDLRIIVFYDPLQTTQLPPEIGKLADAFLPKSGIAPGSILKALDLVLLGASIFSRRLIQDILSARAEGDPDALPAAAASRETAPVSDYQPMAPRSGRQPAGGSLTAREQVILSKLMKGASNKLIARELGIAEATVKIHVKNLMLKIDAKNRTQAAMWGIRQLQP